MNESRSCDYFIIWGKPGEPWYVDESSFPDLQSAERHVVDSPDLEVGKRPTTATIVKVVEVATSSPNPMGKPALRWRGGTP